MTEPKRPIKFNVQGAQSGRMKGGGEPNETGLPKPDKPKPDKPKAGNRSAQAFIDSLQQGK